MTEFLNIENSFEELKNLPIAGSFILPINADIKKFREKIEKMGFPIWIKLNSPEHKMKIDAVKKARDTRELEEEYSKLKKKFENKKFIIQKNTEGVEIIAGIKTDPIFGKVLLIGAGGSFTEILQDTIQRVLPISRDEINLAIKELKISKVIEEKKYNIARLTDLIEKFAKTAEEKIEEADLNPIIVNEKEAVIVDARLKLSS
ncbi:acetate--CoA ligase family protein [Candidatus Pacearchaeota archaeon]|nr:acetate--CoA ligase family protein [Candidatus Pacearchaeota archaeon]